MHSMGKLATQAIAVGDETRTSSARGAINDKLFPMLFDEHWAKGDPGPIASQRFYVDAGAALRSARASVEAHPDDRRVGLRLERRRGGGSTSGGRLRLPGSDARCARTDATAAGVDPVSINPYMQWTDAGLHRSRALVSRRDHRVQRDAGRPRARRRGSCDLASRRRGSVAVERSTRTDRCCRGQPEDHAAQLRRRVRRHG